MLRAERPAPSPWRSNSSHRAAGLPAGRHARRAPRRLGRRGASRVRVGVQASRRPGRATAVLIAHSDAAHLALSAGAAVARFGTGRVIGGEFAESGSIKSHGPRRSGAVFFGRRGLGPWKTAGAQRKTARQTTPNGQRRGLGDRKVKGERLPARFGDRFSVRATSWRACPEDFLRSGPGRVGGRLSVR